MFKFDGDGSDGGTLKLKDGATEYHLVFEYNTSGAENVMQLEIQEAP